MFAAAAASLCALNAEGAFKTELFLTGFARPVYVTAPPGDTNRLFVVEQQTGRIRIVDLATRTILPTPFLTVTNLLIQNEQGLLGLAFHPHYASNGYFYVNQTSPKGGPAGHTEISRFKATGDPGTSDTADPSSKKILLTFDQPEVNHNGGWMAFGSDGFLYFSQGDGGGANDVHGSFGNAQNRASFLGKIHRIDVDHGDPYAIPADNPFAGSTAWKQEIWALGLRNPWRCSFDRTTGDLWIGDVGQGAREEVDMIPAGKAGMNFGWRPREGLIQNSAYPDEVPVSEATSPLTDYTHSSGNNCIIGGYIYRGSAVPELQGRYIFADNGSARFWTFNPLSAGPAAAVDVTAQVNPGRQITAPSSFGEDAAGELYVCDMDGEIYRFVSDALVMNFQNSGANQLVFTFTAAPNQVYTLEAASSLQAPTAWQPITNIAAQASRRDVSLTNEASGIERYFRLRAE